MYKLLIVDDFFVEREMVKDIIKQSNLEIQVIGECSNGKEALSFIERQTPDFLLADIEMPIMNGLELAKYVKNRYPQIKIIFFSLHDKFEYVKKAIDLEAYAYILKPIIRDEMVDSLAKIIRELKQDWQKQQEDLKLKKLLEQSKPVIEEKFKRELLNGLYRSDEDIREKIEYFQLSISMGRFIAMILEIDEYDTTVGTKGFEKRELFSIQVSQIIDSYNTILDRCIWIKLDDRHWSFLFSEPTDNNSVSQLDDKAYSSSEEILGALAKVGISASAGISLVFNDIRKSREMFEQAAYALTYKFNLGKGTIIGFEGIQVTPHEASIELNSIQRELRDILTSGQKEQGNQFIEQLFQQIQQSTSQNYAKNLCFSVVVCLQIVLSELNTNFLAIFGKEQIVWEKLLKFESILDVKQWMSNLLFSVMEFMSSKSSSQSNRIVRSLKEYVNRNYYKQITVKSIADELYYNANYLNTIFRQETGETILEYITKVRVDNAKRLLNECPEMKMYEITQAVGYSHESYFRNIFKQYTGLSLKEFREAKAQEV